jgi:hypothetical protein
MSLYIHPENQRVLWTTINKVKGFSDKPDADERFKQTIARFYHQNLNRVLNRDNLLQLNKETIEYMINQMKQMPASVASIASPIAPSIASPIAPSITPLDPDTKMSAEEMNARITFRSLQDQIDELREEIRALKKPT